MAFEYDYHVHTNLSYCHEGDLSLERLVEIAPTKGLKGFAVTNHAHHLYFDNRSAWKYDYILNYQLFEDVKDKGSEKFKEHIALLRAYRSKTGIDILLGTEVDVARNGELVFDKKFTEQLDLIIGGVHWLPCLRHTFKYSQLIVEFMDFTMMLLEHNITILAHPTRIFRANKLEVPKEVIKPIIQKAKEKGTAIEINSHNYPDPSPEFIRSCIDEGVKLSIGTDTHRIDEFGDFSVHKSLFEGSGVNLSNVNDYLFEHKLLLKT